MRYWARDRPITGFRPPGGGSRPNRIAFCALVGVRARRRARPRTREGPTRRRGLRLAGPDATRGASDRHERFPAPERRTSGDEVRKAMRGRTQAESRLMGSSTVIPRGSAACSQAASNDIVRGVVSRSPPTRRSVGPAGHSLLAPQEHGRADVAQPSQGDGVDRSGPHGCGQPSGTGTVTSRSRAGMEFPTRTWDRAVPGVAYGAREEGRCAGRRDEDKRWRGSLAAARDQVKKGDA